MRKAKVSERDAEPMGIVISSGSHAEEVPRFSAYVWGPAPESAETRTEKMVAA